MQVSLTTFHDLIDHLRDYSGGDVQGRSANTCKRAVLAAMAFFGSYRWSFLQQRGRLTTSAPYSTGTVAYTHSSRQVTLSGGTWPTWAALGTLLIGDVPYDVYDRTSSTLLVLTQASNPGADVAGGTSYSLYRDTYPLPTDFQAAEDFIDPAGGWSCTYVTPQQWLVPQRLRQGPGKPAVYTITGDPNNVGSLAARFCPFPDAAYTWDFIYHRRPRPLRLAEYTAGTATVAAGSATLTGTSTAWTSTMAGCVVRLAAQGEANPPTGLAGQYPFFVERTVLSVADAGTLTLDAVVDDVLSAVKYRISDVIDQDPAVEAAFLRECERQYRLAARVKPAGLDGAGALDEDGAWRLAVLQAREMDSRSLAARRAGGPLGGRRRLIDMPITLDLA